MRTLLFDIDGTLLLTHNSGSGALKRAIEQEFGLCESRVDLDFSGRTDRSILIELLQKNSLSPNSSNIRRLQARYVDQLPGSLSRRGGTLLPGVQVLLSRLATFKGFRRCVMTGNLAETARMKLDHFQLSGHFESIFGGDDDVNRNDLARRAASELGRRYGSSATGDLVVIGDTAADIHCGQAIGAKVVAVATGTQDTESLAAHRPDAVLDNLADTDAVLEVLAS